MSGSAKYADWIAVDWGTSNLRVWAMSGDGEILDQSDSSDGMGKLNQSQFEPALMQLIEPWLGRDVMTVVACGMVGSRQGWSEAPYQTVPATPVGTAAKVACCDPRLDVRILPGLKQMKPADVMRGEETQIAGFLREFPGFDGVICLPGTHTKWVQVSAAEVVSFQTFMTGELFDLLTKSSVLRHSTGQAENWNSDVFLDAVSETLSRSETIGAQLFRIRANDLVHGTEPGTASANLSGALIGAELAAAKPYWLGQQVALIGAGQLVGHYADALKAQGVTAQICSGQDMTLKGLEAAYREISQ